MLFILDESIMNTNKKYDLYERLYKSDIKLSEGIWVLNSEDVSITQRHEIHSLDINEYASNTVCFLTVHEYLSMRSLCFGDTLIWVNAHDYEVKFANGSIIRMDDRGRIQENGVCVSVLKHTVIRSELKYLYRLKKYLILHFRVLALLRGGSNMSKYTMVVHEKSGSIRCVWGSALREPFAVDYGELTKFQVIGVK